MAALLLFWRRGKRPIEGSSAAARAGGSIGGQTGVLLQPDLMAAYAWSTASESTSGTFSTTYTPSQDSSVSELEDLASRLPRIGRSSWRFDDEEGEKHELFKGLLDEFFSHNSKVHFLEMWFSEVGVGWVLGLAEGTSAAGTSLLRVQRNLAERWLRALNEMMRYILRTCRAYSCFDLVTVEGRIMPFVEATVLKMLPFVDALLGAANLDATTVINGAQAPSEKLQTLLDVRVALSRASEDFQLCFGRDWESSVEMEAIVSRRKKELEVIQRKKDEVVSLLSAKEHRLDEAIWNTMEEIRTSIFLNDDDDTDWGIQTLQGSSDICKVTRSLVTCIKSLWNNYWLLNHIVSTAAELGSFLLPEENKADHLTTLTMDMVSSLEVKLAKRAESLPDHSLGFLFLINNTHFICQQLAMAVLCPKIEDHVQKYLQASWEPVLSCLYNHTPHCFRTSSALPKFDSEFLKTYTAQKLWKVPDPELRKRLRKAIVDKVIPDFTRYLEDNNITSPGVTPQERGNMLLELFEG